MGRVAGWLPVTLLGLALVISAAIGLSLHRAASTSIADQLGCSHAQDRHPQAGVEQRTCTYHGDEIVVLTLSKGPHTLSPPLLPDTFVLGSSGGGSAWVVGCRRRDDCVAIKRQVGGDLTSGPLIGLSIVVR